MNEAKREDWMFYLGIAVIASLLLLTSCVRLTDVDGNALSLQRTEVGFSAGVEVTKTNVLKALVKGSVYETGELVSVFGTCLNASDGGYVGSYASMSSWYPNGTLFFQNVSMNPIQEGYFVYIGNMSAVQGTYLTELQCHVNGSDEVAKAFGEWQNPMWVARIGNISDQLANFSVNLTPIENAIANLSVQIGDLNVTVTNGFNTTWVLINETQVLINTTFINLSSQITYVAMVANSSVDRNDSYLAYLLQLIAAGTGTPVNGSLTVTEDAEDPIYFRNWNIGVSVLNEYNQTVSEPLVSCFISTNNDPPTVNELMQSLGNGEFTHTEKIRILTDFTWNVSCVYN